MLYRASIRLAHREIIVFGIREIERPARRHLDDIANRDSLFGQLISQLFEIVRVKQ